MPVPKRRKSRANTHARRSQWKAEPVTLVKTVENGQTENILADAFEALIGAAYIHSGLENAGKIITTHILPLLDDSDALREFADPKTSLAVKLKKLSREEPTYEMSESGPEHERVYYATCYSGKVSLGSGSGRTKRKAETDAALSALRTLSEL
jgi:ribonuclease-3